jgi:hypothetical protein
MKYNLYVRTDSHTYNIFEASEDQLSKLVTAYAHGNSSITLSGRKYPFSGVIELKIFTYQLATPISETTSYYLNNINYRKQRRGQRGYFLPVSTLSKMGKDVTNQFVGDMEYGYKVKPAFSNQSPQFQNSGLSTTSSLMELIKKGENKTLEFKSTLCYDLKENARKPHIEHSILKTIAAFLNSEGGTLLIGVTDEGGIHGLDDDLKVLGSKGDPRDNFNKAFDNLISNNFGRDIHRLLHLTLESIEGKLVAKVEIKEKAPEEVFLVNKEKNSSEEFYVRLNASSVALSGKELSKYIKWHWK